MMASAVSLEEFLKDEVQVFEVAIQRFLKQELADSGNYINEIEEIASRYAKGLGEPDRTFLTHCTFAGRSQAKDERKETESSRKTQTVYNFQKEHLDKHNLYDRAFLLISAPLEEDDILWRETEYESFVSIYPGISDNMEKNPFMGRHVISYTQTCQAIKEFFSSIGNKCILPEIVFNGHGIPAGELKFGNGELIPNDKFIKNIQDSSIEHRKDPNQKWPLAMRIVLGQCWSHIFSFIPSPFVKVIYLSTPESPETNYYKVDVESGGTIIKQMSVHKELQELAIRERKLADPVDGAMTLAGEVCRTLEDEDSQPSISGESSMEVDMPETLSI